MNEHKRDERTYAVIGAAMEVHGVLGSGFLEPVYQEAMAQELTFCGVPSRREVELPIFYKGEKLHTTYRVDFICFESVVVEIKALARLGGTEEAQILNYLKASGHEIGLLLNFGARSLENKRYVWGTHSPQIAQISQIIEEDGEDR